MNDILKQRLVGALILVALGVVFWPIIFVQTEEKSVEGERSVPPPPGVSMAPIEAPDSLGLRASRELAAGGDSPVADEADAKWFPAGEMSDQATSPAASQTEPKASASRASVEADTGTVRSEAPEPLAMDSDGVPVAWTLQVATVSSADKADKLRKRLLDMNQKAYVTTVHSSGKNLFRVSVGPKFERVELEKLQTNINAEFGVTSMVVRYIP